jgi:hypothetical protein
MTSFITQKALTGVTTFALTAAGVALPNTDAKAAPLIFDCYSRSTSDLLMKSALDLSNTNLACVQITALPVGTQTLATQAVISQPVYVAPPSAAPSAGESFFGSVIGGALGGVIGSAINGNSGSSNHTDVHIHQGAAAQQQNQAPQQPGQIVQGDQNAQAAQAADANQGQRPNQAGRRPDQNERPKQGAAPQHPGRPNWAANLQQNGIPNMVHPALRQPVKLPMTAPDKRPNPAPGVLGSARIPSSSLKIPTANKVGMFNPAASKGIKGFGR